MNIKPIIIVAGAKVDFNNYMSTYMAENIYHIKVELQRKNYGRIKSDEV